MITAIDPSIWSIVWDLGGPEAISAAVVLVVAFIVSAVQKRA
jgi:hypothetical protein